MKKVFKFIKSNFKLVLGIIAGTIISGTAVYAVTDGLNANQVDYDNSNSSLSSTNIQDAIDELNGKANTDHFLVKKYKELSGNPINYICNQANVPTTSSSTTPISGRYVYVALYEDGQYGVCISFNGEQECFRAHNYIFESKHILDSFSGGTCEHDENHTRCEGGGFTCVSRNSGFIGCGGGILEMAYINSDNTVFCPGVS